jgi:hypothetical protein
MERKEARMAEEEKETPGTQPVEDDSWSLVENVANDVEAALVVGFLGNHGIPAQIVDKESSQFPTGDEELTLITIAVHTSRLAEARAVLAKREKEFSHSHEGDSSLLTDQGMEDVDQSSEGEEEAEGKR